MNPNEVIEELMAALQVAYRHVASDSDDIHIVSQALRKGQQYLDQ